MYLIGEQPFQMQIQRSHSSASTSAPPPVTAGGFNASVSFLLNEARQLGLGWSHWLTFSSLPIARTPELPPCTTELLGQLSCPKDTCQNPHSHLMTADLLQWYTKNMAVQVMRTQQPAGAPSSNSGMMQGRRTDYHAGKATVCEDDREEPAHQGQAGDAAQVVHGVRAVRPVHV